MLLYNVYDKHLSSCYLSEDIWRAQGHSSLSLSCKTKPPVTFCEPPLALSRQCRDDVVSWDDSILQVDLHKQTSTDAMKNKQSNMFWLDRWHSAGFWYITLIERQTGWITHSARPAKSDHSHTHSHVQGNVFYSWHTHLPTRGWRTNLFNSCLSLKLHSPAPL